jgi:Lar family restriction alleviation protein
MSQSAMMGPTMNDELLPCPFCGEHSSVVSYMVDSRWFVVKCDVCDARWEGYTLAEAVGKWNRRPIEASLKAELAKYISFEIDRFEHNEDGSRNGKRHHYARIRYQAMTGDDYAEESSNDE